MKVPPNSLRDAIFTVGAITAATVLRALIDTILGEPIQYTTFYLAVMVTALHCGLHWGLICTGLSAIAASMLLPPMGRPLIMEPTDFAGMVLFLLVSLLIVWLSHRMRKHQQQAEQATQERQELLEREQAARREAERLNHAKDDFLATVSHELRTPLQSILGWAGFLRDFELDAEEAKMAINSIERSVRLQTQLINDLLDLSRIVMGKIRIDPHPVSLVDVVEAAVQTVYPAAEAKHVRLEADCPAVAAVLGDADRLQQVVWNLLSNAIKFTPGGGTVRAAVEQQGDYVELVVSDTGEGIDAELLPRVFERFKQGNGAGRREGLGLGLAIVKELVELHGGTIRVHSEGKGKGAEFRAILPKHCPAAVKPESGSKVSARCEGQPPLSLAGKQVLVIDDDLEARRLIHTVLHRHGAKVTTAESASKAVQVLSGCRPDVVTCDLDMPGVDGFALVRILRKQYEEPSLPIVALTASASEADRRRALESGFQEHLGKPVEPHRLVAALAELAHSH